MSTMPSISRELAIQLLLSVPLMNQGHHSRQDNSSTALLQGTPAMSADSSVSPSLDAESHWGPFVKFVVLSLLCMLPRLYVGSAAQAAYGGNMLSGNRRAIAMAITYHACEAMFPSWLQWFVHACMPGAPFPMSLAGLEWTCISILAWILDQRPVLAFVIYNLADAFIHPARRQILNRSHGSNLLLTEQYALFWFGRSYLICSTIRRYFPNLISGVVFWTFWACISLLVVAFVVMLVTDGSHPAESAAPAPTDMSKAKYNYAPLKDGETIRLLRVYPSLREKAPVKCDLVQVRLSGYRPGYVAISYRWEESGKTDATGSILQREDSKVDQDNGIFDLESQVNMETESLVHEQANKTRTIDDAQRSESCSQKAAEILVNGYTYPVFPNVLSILKDIRSPLRQRFVWIDSICINQEDRKEKEKQVAMMRDIYSNCNNVVVCLSGADIESYGFFSEMRRIFGICSTSQEKEIDMASKMILRLRDSRFLQDFSPHDRPEESFLSLGNKQEWDALEKMVNNPWFERAWIIQEVTVAPWVDIRYCGTSLGWGSFTRAMSALSRSGLRRFSEFRQMQDDRFEQVEMPGIENALILENLRLWYAEGELLSLLDTMILCLKFAATWEVDKIFSILGIIAESDRQNLAISPDYTNSKEEVYRRLAWRLISSSGPEDQFRVLRFAGIGQPRNLNVSSWAPDWTAKLNACVLEHRDPKFDYRASPKPIQRMQFSTPLPPSVNWWQDPPDFLECKGYSVDIIVELEDISEIPSVDSDRFPFRDALSKAKLYIPSQYCHTRQPIEEAFWRTLIADTEPETSPANEEFVDTWREMFTDYETLREKEMLSEEQAREVRHLYRVLQSVSSEDMRFTHLLSTDLSKRRPRHGGDISSVLRRNYDYTHIRAPRVSAGRQFCITEKGYMGVVPLLSKTGDKVIILHGAKTPHIIRVCSTGMDDTQIKCQLVGECYMHGMMHHSVGCRNLQEKTFAII